eukprot:Mycagemm_TRINITY_DN9850_c0_g1::TRINITY_DN9850_c0_g1_i1::g.216::m.216 type:complete len:105 gc:universal TRINITY_DN9850_c0_g1_i1:373-59(-)
MFNPYTVTLHLIFFQQVTIVTHKASQTHYYSLTNRINWWIGYLGKQLFEIRRQVLRLLRKHCQRCICSHRTNRLLTLYGHWFNQQIDIFSGIAKYLLVIENRFF